MIIDRLNKSIEVKKQIIENKELIATIENAANILISAFKNGNKVLFCGNGGSAADAQHLAAELSGKFYFDRPPLPAEACHVNASFLTAVGNDYGYKIIFSRYVKANGKKGDILIGFLLQEIQRMWLKPLRAAKENEMICIGFTGENGGKMKELSDLLINIPSNDTPRIQEAHITIGHIICEIVEKTLFGND